MSIHKTAFLDDLVGLLGPDKVHLDESECIAYSYDNSKRQVLPLAVVFGETPEDIITLIQCCRTHKVPITARGAGSGTVGGCIPVENGIVVSCERMNKIIRIDPDNRLMVVEPGVTNQAVQDAAGEHGFFWAPDPSSAAFATVGGNLGYNAAGPRAVKYGTTRENTLGLEVITGEGKLLKTGVFTTKGVVGYDLTRLLIGSEGTLAFITQATLKLTPLPEAKASLRILYNDVSSAVTAITQIMRCSVTPCALEFMDTRALSLIKEHADIKLPVESKAMLMVEVDGTADALLASIDVIKTVAYTDGLIDFRQARTQDEITALWQARKSLSPTLRHIAPNKINEDIVVPVSNIPALIKGLDALAEEYQITIVNFGHAGNGNIHVNLLYDDVILPPPDVILSEAKDLPESTTHINQCLEKVFTLVLSLDGTLSGEHGVGLSKKAFIATELSPYHLDLMKRLKQQFDPDNILNPDKMFE